jgi:hypothetical protein
MPCWARSGVDPDPVGVRHQIGRVPGGGVRLARPAAGRHPEVERPSSRTPGTPVSSASERVLEHARPFLQDVAIELGSTPTHGAYSDAPDL